MKKDEVTIEAKQEWEKNQRRWREHRRSSSKKSTEIRRIPDDKLQVTPLKGLRRRLGLRNRSSPKKRLQDYFNNNKERPDSFDPISQFTELSPEDVRAMSESPAVKALQERNAARRRKMEEALELARLGQAVGQLAPSSPGIQVEQPGIGNTHSRNASDTPTRMPSVGSHTNKSSPVPVPPPVAAQPVTLPSVQLQVKETPRPHAESGANNVAQSSKYEMPEEDPKSQSSQIKLRGYFQEPHLVQGEYAVGLPLSTKKPREGRHMHQRDIHLTKISEASKDINEFLTNPDSADIEPLRSRIRSHVRSISLVVSHPELAHPELALHPSLKDVPDENLAEYHMIMSSKMQFLKELIYHVKDESVRIGIVADPAVIVRCRKVLL